MKRHALFVSSLIIPLFTGAQSLTLQWVTPAGGPGNEYYDDVAVDAAYNVYAGGSFVNICDFDPGVGVFTLSANGWHPVKAGSTFVDLNGDATRYLCRIPGIQERLPRSL